MCGFQLVEETAFSVFGGDSSEKQDKISAVGSVGIEQAGARN
jgi:hypothetical protein